MSRSLWRTCSRSRANTKSSTPGFLPTCFEGHRSFCSVLSDALNVLWRPAKILTDFDDRRCDGERFNKRLLSFGEVAIGSLLPACSCEHKVSEKQKGDRNENKHPPKQHNEKKTVSFSSTTPHRNITFPRRRVPMPLLTTEGA